MERKSWQNVKEFFKESEIGRFLAPHQSQIIRFAITMKPMVIMWFEYHAPWGEYFELNLHRPGKEKGYVRASAQALTHIFDYDLHHGAATMRYEIEAGRLRVIKFSLQIGTSRFWYYPRCVADLINTNEYHLYRPELAENPLTQNAMISPYFRSLRLVMEDRVELADLKKYEQTVPHKLFFDPEGLIESVKSAFKWHKLIAFEMASGRLIKD
jgi:hypothetical protein